MRPLACSLLSLATLLLTPASAFAGEGETDLTTIVLMRDGNRTVMSIRASHRGDPSEFIPAAIDPDDIEIVDPAVFDRLETISAPRLVDFWERDPCKVRPAVDYDGGAKARPTTIPERSKAARSVEVRDELAEADVAVQISYDADELMLPLPHGSGDRPHDLLIYVLARETRYAVADYDNVTIPTDVRVYEHVREQFPEFYATLLDRVFTYNPRAFVIEHASVLSFCDPCVASPLTAEELAQFGADKLPSYAPWYRERRASLAHERELLGELVLTRMRARYKGPLPSEALRFRATSALAGGVGSPVGVSPSQHLPVAWRSRISEFQARYLIVHEWPEPHDCWIPHRGFWGRPWTNQQKHAPQLAHHIERVSGRLDLDEAIPANEWFDLDGKVARERHAEPLEPKQHDDDQGCAHCSLGPTDGPLAGLVPALLGAFGCLRLRRRSRR